jgi:hypothetical protein
MIPREFPEQTKVLSKPQGMTDEECGSLGVFNDPEGRFCVSCWRPTWRERLSILLFGRIWVWVWSGRTQPPIALEGKRTIFTKTEG